MHMYDDFDYYRFFHDVSRLEKRGVRAHRHLFPAVSEAGAHNRSAPLLQPRRQLARIVAGHADGRAAVTRK